MNVIFRKKQLFVAVLFLFSMLSAHAQVPWSSKDIMLQGFAWDSHGQTKWTQLNSQAQELSAYFSLIWLPPSAAAEGGGSSNMG